MTEERTVSNYFPSSLQKLDLSNILNFVGDYLKWLTPGNVENIEWLGKKYKQEIESFFKFPWKQT